MRHPSVRCEDWKCGWRGRQKKVLKGRSPFSGEEIEGCPRCLGIDCLEPVCDEPKCWQPTTCGTPTPEGYRRTCGQHCPRGLAASSGLDAFKYIQGHLGRPQG